MKVCTTYNPITKNPGKSCFYGVMLEDAKIGDYVEYDISNGHVKLRSIK